jgi:hypothetical protein
MVDTAADETLLPRSIGDAIGATMDDTQRWRVVGFAGQEVEVILGEVELELNGDGHSYQWSSKIGFVSFPAPEDEVVVLGHAGCLHFFGAFFHGDTRDVELLPTASFPGTVR